jgi:hypothetical protein
MEFDSEDRKMIAIPCDYSHVRWCIQVGYDALNKKISETTALSWDGYADLLTLLLWKPTNSIFFRPSEFAKESNGLMAFQCFWDNDTKGVSFPASLEDPETLADLIQAKAVKGLDLEMWRQDYFKWLSGGDIPFFPEEYLTHPGMTEKLFISTFGREPDKEAVKFFLNQ